MLFLYKYKKSKNDLTWYLAVSGLQPANIKEFSTNQDIQQLTDIIYDPGKALAPQFNKVLRRTIYDFRYNTTYYGYEPDYVE